MTSSELDAIRGLPVTERLPKLVDYIDRAETRLREARTIRDSTIRELRALGISRPKVAEMADVSVAYVATVTHSALIASDPNIQ